MAYEQSLEAKKSDFYRRINDAKDIWNKLMAVVNGGGWDLRLASKFQDKIDDVFEHEMYVVKGKKKRLR